MTNAFSDHHIVCGFDPVARVVARELRTAGAACVVVDPTDAAAELASILGVPFVRGAPSDPELLRAAGIAGARSLVACAGDDDDNVATIVAARELRADLTIVARAAGERSEQRLTRAGAQRVVSLEWSGGIELARRALNADAGEPQENLPGHRVVEIVVGRGGAATGHAIGAVRGAAYVVGLRRANGWFVPLPPDDMKLRPGDQVMALGTPATLEPLERLLAAGGIAAAPPAAGLPRTQRRY